MFERNKQEISQIIGENLEAILSGSVPMEEVIRQHPQHAADLRRELETALWLISNRKQVQPRPGFLENSRKRVIARVKAEPVPQEKKRGILGISWPQKRLAYQLAAALTIVVLLLSAAGGVVSSAQGSIPGHHLYRVKKLGETIAYTMAGSDVRRVELGMRFIDRRFQELEALVELSEFGHVEETLADYGIEVKRAVAALHQFVDRQVKQRSALAGQLNQGLFEKADRLASLEASVPADLRARFTEAREMTLANAAIALGFEEEFGGLAGTVTPTTTVTPTPTLTQTATATLRFTNTPKPEVDDGETDESGEIVEDPEEKEKKPTITPRPTNTHRPTQKVKDTKEPKPPKEEKPTKTDKKDS